MTKEWYISFHGGVESGALNNIHVYSVEGRKLRKALNQDSLTPPLALRELRGITLGPDGNLYVVNAFQEFSQILRFSGKLNQHGQHDFCDVFVQYDSASNPGLRHPFNAVFDSHGDLHVTSQDTSVSLRYRGPKTADKVPSLPMPLPAAFQAGQEGRLFPGKFCASAKQVPHGLVVVREAMFVGGLLYVADRDADCVRKYSAATAEYLGKIAAAGLIDKPIHLAWSEGVLYIGNRGNESVAKCDLRSGNVTTFVAAGAGGLKNPAGLAFGGDDYLYVASRGSRQILRFKLADGRPDHRPFIDGLEDDPEFIELLSRA